jgi:hypothetical protein
VKEVESKGELFPEALSLAAVPSCWLLLMLWFSGAFASSWTPALVDTHTPWVLTTPQPSSLDHAEEL